MLRLLTRIALTARGRWRHRCGMMMTPYRKGIMRIATVTIAGLAGCATVPETAWTALEVEGVEQEVICSGACDEEWRRAKEWIKKYSGYAFPAEVVVKPDRIEAFRVPFRDCVSVPQARRQFLARCTRPPLASEPLGFGDTDDPFSRIGKAFADGGPHWTFLVLRDAEEGGWSRIRLGQHCWAERSSWCRVPGIRRHRQDRFRRFVRTGEHLSQQ